MNTQICPTCHAPIPPHAPGGFCPACLLRDAEEPAPADGTAPSLGEIAAAFPQLEIVRLIGQGGMGFVYQARQPGLDRTVALKILSPGLGGDPAFAERFAREARALGKLNHPNIVTVFEHGESGGFFYLLMEYVDGVNLRQAMRAGRFTPEQALAIVPPICDALQAAHAEGIWHRDIKPENILLDARGGVKMADFGIARIVGDGAQHFTLTRTGGVLGSAAYMAPEQHEKPHDVDHRADIYSLGVVIYEMLTGELPLGRFPAPSQRAAVNVRIDEIVLRTLEKERELRQQSAGEVKTEVEGVKCTAPAARPAAIGSPRPWRPYISAALVGLGIFLCFLGLNKPLFFAAGVAAMVLGSIGLIFEARRSGRTGRIVAIVAFALVVLLLPGLMVLLSRNRNKVGSYMENERQAAGQWERDRMENAQNGRVQFRFIHPQQPSRHGGAGIGVPAMVIQDWVPDSDGSPVSDNKDLRVRVRIVAVYSGAVVALAESSQDGKNWETKTVTLTKSAPSQKVRFSNGTEGTVELFHDEFSTPEKLVKFHIKAAAGNDPAVFESNLSTRWVDQIALRKIDSRPFLQPWSGLSYSRLVLGEASRATVRLADRATGSEYNVPVVLLGERNWRIDSLEPIDVTGCTPEEELRRTNAAAFDDSTPRDAVESLVKAAKRKDAEAFKRGISADMQRTFNEAGGLAEPMQQWAECSYVDQVSNDGDQAWIRMKKDRTIIPMSFVRQNDEWKLSEIKLPTYDPMAPNDKNGEREVAAPEGVDSPRAAMEQFLQAAREKDKESMKARSSKSLIAIADDDGPLDDDAFGLLRRGRIVGVKRLNDLNAEVTVESDDKRQPKATFRMVWEDGIWKLTENVVKTP